ncbi:hypothetical protein CRG98_012124 [Punica granatum]|uniref:Uncharacterized protein n=1 Tax=Punica granatum TaxID=22663 RepID=A0A2I0KGV4_PUNGR|nr:hypothetical protein CRG98_012124 [Punica granatum]
MENLTSLSRRGALPSLDVRGKESGKQREGRVTRLDAMGDGHPRAAAAAAWGKWGLSDRDHLFTGESVGREGPFECDGTTHRSRGKK